VKKNFLRIALLAIVCLSTASGFATTKTIAHSGFVQDGGGPVPIPPPTEPPIKPPGN